MYTNNKQFSGSWAIILGGSSGFGLASVKKLAAHGMHIAIIYRETALTEKSLKQAFANISEANNVKVLAFNINALDASARDKFLTDFTNTLNQKKSVKLLLHSIARGNLKPLVNEQPGETDSTLLTTEDIRFTTYAMATSMLDWARAILNANLFEADARVIGLTSEGAHKYWDGYAAVSIAKSSLESLTTYMAVEFAKFGLKSNLIQAGITETPSLKMIPESDKLLQIAKERNPLGRATTPADVANVVYLLCTPEAAWINGSLIHVDGGEHCK